MDHHAVFVGALGTVALCRQPQRHPVFIVQIDQFHDTLSSLPPRGLVIVAPAVEGAGIVGAA